MSKHFPKIRIPWDHGGGLAVREGLSACFYMLRPHQEVGPAALRALEAYLRVVGPRALAWYSGGDEEDWLELDDPGWALIHRTLLDSRFASLELRDELEGAGQFRFTYLGRCLDDSRSAVPLGQASAACFWLSSEYLEAHGPAHVHSLVLALARELPFDSGHAGLCFHAEEGLGVLSAIHPLCLRYPGLDIPDMAMASLDIGTRVRGVHWLNFFGPHVLRTLGGVEGLRSRLSAPGTVVEELGEERAAVTLGEWPEAGDTAEGRTLPAYRELARVLEPWLYRRDAPFHSFTEEDTRRWERRFLD